MNTDADWVKSVSHSQSKTLFHCIWFPVIDSVCVCPAKLKPVPLTWSTGSGLHVSLSFWHAHTQSEWTVYSHCPSRMWCLCLCLCVCFIWIRWWDVMILKLPSMVSGFNFSWCVCVLVFLIHHNKFNRCAEEMSCGWMLLLCLGHFFHRHCDTKENWFNLFFS